MRRAASGALLAAVLAGGLGLLALAVFFGRTRLIDNAIIRVPAA